MNVNFKRHVFGRYTGVQYCFNIHRYGIMVDASEVSVSNIFIEQIKTAIRNVRKASNRRPDVKVIY